ncbi:cyclin-dependent kinase inhibitor 3 isoform X3 [Tympanuchus pallidicinctus]|uniref:cyclin-dependent kinase inhibitor 3 isoform X3 n=1 Tax=Tympanuchus pallidicinctus TaxID=109042 RepID=UPI002287582C|nr:cyclin-dependent kinase inhibitor 3 isoform X3 [Tympanuchus pallidicinctus]
MHVAGFDSSDEEAAEEEEGEEPAPLPLSWLPLPPAYSSAFLAVCSLPGCRFKDIRRNLQKDIDELKSCGTQDVFVLCTKGELLKYRVPNLIDAYQERGICVHHYPIPDGDAPDVTTCCTILEELRSCLESNRKTIIHCYGGLGRSCLIAACLLLQLSDVVTPQQAIDSLRELRGSRAIQTVKDNLSRVTERPGLEGTSRMMKLQPPTNAGPPTSTFHSSPGCPGPHPTWP